MSARTRVGQPRGLTAGMTSGLTAGMTSGLAAGMTSGLTAGMTSGLTLACQLLAGPLAPKVLAHKQFSRHPARYGLSSFFLLPPSFLPVHQNMSMDNNS